MMSRECSEQVGRFMRREDEAWCEGFVEGWNAQACYWDGFNEITEDYEERIDELLSLLEATKKQLAAMTEGFNLLAKRVREGQ